MDEKRLLEILNEEIERFRKNGERCSIDKVKDKLRNNGIDIDNEQSEFIQAYFAENGAEIEGIPLSQLNEDRNDMEFEQEPSLHDLEEENEFSSQELQEAMKIPSNIAGEQKKALTEYIGGLHLENYPLLTREEEIELAKKVAKGDENAKNKFTMSNMRLVLSIAKRFLWSEMPLMDLCQEGWIGLNKAVLKFDYKKGHKFSTYATWWIKQSIFRYINDNSRTIRIPENKLRKIYKYNCAVEHLTQKLGRQPSLKEVSYEMNETRENVEKIKKMSQQSLVSLDASIGDEGETRVADTIEDKKTLSPEEAVSNFNIHAVLNETVLKKAGLDEIQRLVLIFFENKEMSEYKDIDQLLKKVNEIKRKNGKREVKKETLRNSILRKSKEVIREYIDHEKYENPSDLPGYELTPEKYAELFRTKYSFYSLMRRIQNWYLLNKNKDPKIEQGFRKFWSCISGLNKNNRNKFNFLRQVTFFSDDFINANFYGTMSQKLLCDYYGKYTERQIEIRKDKENKLGVNFQSGSLNNIFLKSTCDNDAIIAYSNIIFNKETFQEEEKRVKTLVSEWFPNENIRRSLIDDVIEKRFMNRGLVSIYPAVRLPDDVGSKQAIYLQDNFYEMIYSILYQRTCKNKEKNFFSNDDLENASGLKLEGSFTLKSGEDRLNDFFDNVEKTGNEIVVGDFGKIKVHRNNENSHLYKVNYIKSLVNCFEKKKAENSTTYIADIIITTLCLNQISTALNVIWQYEYNEDSVMEDSVQNVIRKICTYPAISQENLIEELKELKQRYNDFYKTEWSFLNGLVYDNWESLKTDYKEIDNKDQLLEYSFNEYHDLKEKSLETDYKEIDSKDQLLEYSVNEYHDSKEKSLENNLNVDLIEKLKDEYNIKRFIMNNLYLYANAILEKKNIDKYDDVEYIINDSWGEIEEYKIYILKAKLHIAQREYLDATKAAIKAYNASLNEGIVNNYILPALKEMNLRKEKYSRNDLDFLSDKSIEKSISFWEEVRNYNGDACFIREKWSEKCKKELENRITKLREKYNDLDMDVNIHKARKSISIKDKTKDIYIVLGFSEKAQAFVDSIVDKIDVEIKLVLQRNEMNKLYFLEEWYKNTNIEIVNTDIIEIISELELYNLWDGFNEDPLRFKNYCENNVKKIHFLALGDNKSDNLTSVITIINETWKRYVMYRILEPITDYKIDFSEIDIIVDSMPTTPWYLDSIINRFEDDFYIKINSYSEYDLAIRELLMEYPLFLSDLNNKNNEARHDILVLGDNKIIPDIIKNILMVNGFMRSDKITKQHLTAAAAYKYEDFEQNICSDSSLYIVDKNASVIRDKILCDCPDIFKDRDYVHCKPQFYDLDIFGYKFHQLFGVLSKDELYVNRLESITDLEQKIQLELYDIVRNANYIIIATDNEEESIALSMKIREYRYRWNIQDEPVISVYTPESNIDENINEFTIGKETYGSAWHRNYHINMFGKRRKIYSKEYLYENYFNVISHELHMDDDYKKREQKEKDYYKVVYNRKSCDARAIAVPYVMYSVLGEYMVKDFTLSANHKMGINKWSMDIFCDFIDNYLTKYHSIVGDEKSRGIHPGWREIIACLEHYRWNYWMMAVQGYSSSPFGDETMQYVKDTIRSWAERTTEITKDNEKNAVRDNKLYIAKMHFAIRTFDSLGEPEDNQGDACGFEKTMLELHDEKGVTEGMSTTKNRKYDRKYAMEMVSSLARAFNIRSYNDKSR